MPGERGQRGEALRVLGRVRVVHRKRWGEVVLPLGNDGRIKTGMGGILPMGGVRLHGGWWER